MSDKIFYCCICEQTWSQLPEGTIQLTEGRGPSYKIYRFADGSIHSLKKVQSTEERLSGIQD